jgi:23S rRNA (pseudouridine1915-N3)-methyltransferase
VKLTFVSVGRDRSGLFLPAIDEYKKRLEHVAKVHVVELPESKKTGPQARDDEATAIVGRLTPRDVLVALDERGKLLTSVELSGWIGRNQDSARDVMFVVGGDEGLSEDVRKKAGLVLSLSRMTLPHRLARLVLIEQVYRAFTILRGEPYHK